MKPIIYRRVRGGFSAFDLLIMIAIIAILAALLLPALAKAKSRAQRISCVNNLKQVGLAFRIFATDNNEKMPAAIPETKGGTQEHPGDAWRHFQCLSNIVMIPKVLICPIDNRTVARDFQTLRNENVSYFVGLDADEASPQRLLSGDRNLSVDGAPVATGLLTLKADAEIGWTSAMHNNAGNVGLADGSVQQTDNLRLRNFVEQSGLKSLRFAVP